ncbi:G-protein coupled receptor Mth2-like [Nylanderia fulva]|uniref:G-protein coupled receptor Mth2-like n=1 Tax=Nylanderia fulva TaxID=613905 RepID=UPI0010FB0EA3|nr:G-protein coupled receptor Mth2-like [Nylanderia fulva]
MSSYFWMNIMSFNMWRTFRGFSSLQKNVNRKKKSEKKKLLYYVIFAYGCPFILGIVCVIIVDLVSEYIPVNLRPEFQMANCGYNGKLQNVVYLFWIETVCIISTVCLSISTALNIKCYEKNTDLRLTDSESKRYNDNKKWFKLYMQLFIVMSILVAINWVLFTMLLLITNKLFLSLVNNYYLYVIVLLDIVNCFCNFIIFVWKKKIKLMLMKRFGYETKATSS